MTDRYLGAAIENDGEFVDDDCQAEDGEEVGDKDNLDEEVKENHHPNKADIGQLTPIDCAAGADVAIVATSNENYDY